MIKIHKYIGIKEANSGINANKSCKYLEKLTEEDLEEFAKSLQESLQREFTEKELKKASVEIYFLGNLYTSDLIDKPPFLLFDPIVKTNDKLMLYYLKGCFSTVY